MHNLHHLRVMSKRRKRIILLGCGTLALALVWAMVPESKPEPSYQGRLLSEWLDRASMGGVPDSTRREAEAAVRAIGTNALPTLLGWIRYEYSPVRELYASVVTRLPLSEKLRNGLERISGSAKATIPHWSAGEGFRILNTNAVTAIPQLFHLAAGPNRRPVARRAVQALGGIGPPAVPHLITLVTNRNGPVSHEAVIQLALLATNVPTVTPLFLQFVEDPAFDVSYAACFSLQRAGVSPQAAVPVLIRALQSKHEEIRLVAAHALGGYGADAIPAVPQLQAGLLNTNWRMRYAATNALLRIAPQILTNEPPQ